MQTLLDITDYYNLLSARTLDTFSKMLSRRFRENDISLTNEQCSILTVLWKEEDGCSQQVLADKTYRDKPSITRLVDNLEKDKWVERRAHPTDRRQNLIYLTAKAKKIEAKVFDIIQETIEIGVKGIDEKDVIKFKETFEKIYNNFSEYEK